MPAYVDRANGHSRRDEELEDAVRNAILRHATIRIWGHALEIVAREGVVDLNGHVRTRSSRDIAERVVREVSGVREVNNHLYVDTDIEVAVAQSLARDPRTRGSFPGILVGSSFGEIFLKGDVASAEIKKAAQEIAATVTGVREVTNQLLAPEPPKPAPAKPAPKVAPKPAPKAAEAEDSSGEE